MLERTLSFAEDKKDIELNKGDWYVQRPGLLQQGISGSPAPSYFYIHFTAEELGIADENRPCVVLAKRGLFDHKLLRPLFDQLDYCSRLKAHDIMGIQSIFLSILNSISFWPHSEDGLGLGYKITQFISENYNKDIRCEVLADRFHFSTEYINRKVKQYSGLTPGQYLQQIRIARAMELLSNTDQILSLIAAEVGYHDTTVFYKAFRKQSGMSPGDWREKSRGMIR
jgi:AraC-like DNA-binding protein